MDEQTKAILSAIAVLAVSAAAMFGIKLDEGAMLDALCACVIFAANAYAAWKNHNFTPEAAKAQEYLDELKAKHARKE